MFKHNIIRVPQPEVIPPAPPAPPVQPKAIKTVSLKLDVKELEGQLEQLNEKADRLKETMIEIKQLSDSPNDDCDFNKTIIEMKRCTTDGELVSRSQAKRVLARLDKFKKVILDFSGVKVMEQGFADELFRVGLNDLDGVVFEVINANEDVRFIIKHVLTSKTINRINIVS